MSRRTHLAGILLVISLLWAAKGFCASETNRISWSSNEPGLKVIRSDAAGMEVQLDISYLRFIQIYTADTSYIRMLHPDFVPDYHAGSPELPILRKFIEIPANSKVIVENVQFETYDFHLDRYGLHDKIYPNQPSVQKGKVQQRQEFHLDRKVYGKDEFTGDSLVSIRAAGILRGRQLAYLTFSPFRYNPVSGILEVRDHITVRLRFEGGDQAKTLERHKSLTTPVFENTFSKILNYTPEESKSVVTHPLKMVILTDSIFKNSLDDFILWKKAKGIDIIVAYRGAPGVGTSVAEMKAYLTNLYYSATPDDPAPSYLLIIGDVDQIPPSSSSGHVTDLYYAEYDGNGDYIPDIYYGRFSANDSVELAAILEKNLEYEQYLFPDPSFLGEAVMIAGVDGAYASVWGNGQINYGTHYYYNSDHGIQSHTYLYPESGNSDAQIISDISNGVGFVNYTGHGYSDRWEDPRFSIYDIDGLQNNHKYPVMIGNGCVTATFGLQECFAEALVRTPGKGALTYIGCSNDSYWDEDYYWAVGVGPIVAQPSYEETGLGMYDRLFHDHGEPETEWYINQSQMVFAGNMAVMTGVPSRGQYYWEIYQLLGDPSLMMYLNEPDSLPVNVPGQIPLGLTNLTVITEDNTVVTLSDGDSIIATSYSNADGIAILNFPALADTGYIRIVATRQNRIPYIDSIEIINNNLPYIVLEDLTVNDSAENGNQLADFGETLYTAIHVRNLGLTDANQVDAVLSCPSGNITLVDSVLEPLPLLKAQQDTILWRGFSIRVHDSIQDGTIVTCIIHFSDDKDSTWVSYYALQLHGPDIVPGSLAVNDSEKGNGNLRLEPGESVKLNLQLSNTGSATSDTVIIRISMPDSMVTFYEDSLIAGVIAPGDEKSIPVSVTISPDVLYGTPLNISADIRNGAYRTEANYTIPVGLSFDDFELGNFSAIPWDQDSLHPWIVTDQFSGEGRFSARSAAISHNQKSELTVSIETFQDDSVWFMAKVSSEKDYDFLRFYIDDAEQAKWSGEMSWNTQSFPLTKGQHKLTWKYTKDVSVSRGYDAAWIDYVVFPLFSFSSLDAGVPEIIGPKSGPGLTDAEPLKIMVKNYGSSSLTDIPLGFILNGQPKVSDTLRTALNPGDTTGFTFAQTLDLQNIGDYTLKVFTDLPNDQVPLNDTLSLIITHEGVVDIALDSILSPLRDSFYTDQETIGVRVINLSSGSVNNIPLGYSIASGPPVTETATVTLSPGDTLDYYFQQKADLSDTGSIELMIFSALSGDVITTNDTLVVLLYNLNTSIPPGILIQNLKVYPNPAEEILNIRYTGKGPDKVTFLIADMSSRICYSKSISQFSGVTEISLPVGHLPSGSYHLIIYNNKGRISVPFIKTGN